MKKLHTVQTAQQRVKAADRLKRPVLWVFMLCFLIGTCTIVSMAEFGKRLDQFSVDDANVIVLTLPEDVRFRPKEEETPGSFRT